MSALTCARERINEEDPALLAGLELGHIFSLLLHFVTALGFTKPHSALKADLILSVCYDAVAEARHHNLGDLVEFPAQEKIPCPSSAEQSSTGPILPVPYAGMQGKDSIASQAAVMQVHAEYSTGTCFLQSVRFINSWGQGHACNTLISGATVQ